MSYSTKNYSEQGGEKIVIGGEIKILSGGKLVIDTGGVVEGLPKASVIDDSTATTIEGLVADYNSLLAKLRTAGLIVSA